MRNERYCGDVLARKTWTPDFHNHKVTLTPYYFRHNYVTMLYESGIDPLVAMKIVGHTDYQTTANIYTHIKEEMLKKATVDLEGVFKKRAGKE